MGRYGTVSKQVADMEDSLLKLLNLLFFIGNKDMKNATLEFVKSRYNFDKFIRRHSGIG